ncbi:MAG TPA: alpha/beta hydrolase domain-containing protein [Terriglobales bacterium]|nr:alpha/beta hydrolase domain-containing protein [Terriglobales bacterium]
MRARTYWRILIAAIMTFAVAATSRADLVRINVQKRSVVLGGQPFGKVGSYERIVGKAYFTLDPKLPVNRQIVDLGLAPKNKNGLVEFSADLYILKPTNLQKGNGAVLMEASNRGNKWLLTFFDNGPDSIDPQRAADFGDGFLLRHGYTLVWIGWQFDIGKDARPMKISLFPTDEVMLKKDLLRLYAPVAEGITGTVRAEITVDQKEFIESVAHYWHEPYPVLNPEDPKLQLTVKDYVEGPITVVPREDWHVVDGTKIALRTGFEPGRIYDLVYRSKNPPVAGVGFAAIRDTASWLKYGADVSGAPKLDHLPRAYGFGVSESGRFFRTFLYYGFNRDEKDRLVFDGILDDVGGGGRGSFNIRFAQPSRVSDSVWNTLYPVDIFPFTDLEEQDPTTGVRDGLLTHATPPQFWPRIFYLNSATEYYHRALSLIHTTINGKADAALPPTTRIYSFAGSSHLPGAFPPKRNKTVNPTSPVEWTMTFPALLDAMDSWVRAGKEPPPSRYPLIAKKELVPLRDVAFPHIPKVAFPKIIHLAYPEDFGPEFFSRGIVTQEPPKFGAPYPVLVPQVDGDGNDIGGVRMPEVQVPLATYTGWNLRPKEIGASDQLAIIEGSFIPFALTKAERIKTGDPRPSIEERYSSREEYMAKFKAAAETLMDEGYLLSSDVPAQVKRGGEIWDYVFSHH